MSGKERLRRSRGLASLGPKGPMGAMGELRCGVVLWGWMLGVMWAQGGGGAVGPGLGGGGGGGGLEIRDVLPPVEIPYWTVPRVALWSGAGVLMLAGLIWAGLEIWRRTRPVVVPPTPMQTALEALRRLKGGEIAVLSARDFAAQVATILRRFLEATLGLEVTRQTTDEFLASMEADPRFEKLDRERLRVFLEHCDRCKFAGVEAAAEARSALVAAAEAQVIGGSGGSGISGGSSGGGRAS
jgi:hypothetical protein